MLKKIYKKIEEYGLLQVLGYIFKRILKEIKRLGEKIGLHFDEKKYKI